MLLTEASDVSDSAAAAASPSRSLRAGTLGATAIGFMVISAVAPLTSMAGVLPISMVFAGGTGIVPAYVCATVLVLIFAVGYVTLARHIRSAGAFYALISRSLGGVSGGAAAFIALFGYNCMQIGMSGMLGPATADLVRSLTGVSLPWWMYSIGFALLIGAMGLRQIDFSAKILAFLVLGEFGVIIALDAVVVYHGVPGGISLAPFAPGNLFNGSAGLTLQFAIGCFVGFEATTIYSEEARDPVRTIPRATYGAVLLIGAFYTLSTVWIVEAAGLDTVVENVQKLSDPIQFIFNVADAYAGSQLSMIMRALFVTSLFACLLAFHNNVARYFYVLGRDGMLPSWLGYTHPRYDSPFRGTIVQTVLSVAVLTGFAVAGLDPLLTLFAWIAPLAVISVIALMALVSLGVVVYFRRNPTLEPGRLLQTLVFPTIALVGLSAVLYGSVATFSIMTGTTGILSVFLPSLILVAGLIGAWRAMRLKAGNASAFRHLGENQVG